MARSSRTRGAERTEAEKYRQVGDSLLESAAALVELSGEGDRYGNAIGVLAIHAAIAWTDALTIAYGARKSIDGDHTKAADVMAEVLGREIDEQKLKLLRGVLAGKDKISYTGTFYDAREARQILKRTTTFVTWARALYERRPPSRNPG